MPPEWFCPPIGKQKHYPKLILTAIHAQERGTPRGRDRIYWKLLTDLPVSSRKQAIEKLTWYSLRWKIETFHKILKSGCKAEESKLQNRRTTGELAGGPLHPQLANLLDDHAQPRGARCNS